MNRDKIERDLARIVARALRETMNEVLDGAQGDHPLDAALWEKLAAKLRAALTPYMADVATASAREFQASGSVDFDLVNSDAQAWARQYTYDLVAGVVERTSKDAQPALQAALRDAIAAGFNRGQTNATIAAALEPLFGAQRAATIAVTEITRAAVQGEKVVVDRLAQSGIRMRAVWLTVRDERVCPICEPRDKTKQGDGWDDLPPAHPNCRCMLRWEVA